MRTEIIELSSKNTILFYIGKYANDNSDVVRNGDNEDLWFHAEDCSSCHVVAMMPDKCTKKEKHQIIKSGALLCKKYTNKLRSIKNVPIVYTKLRNLVHTSTPGLVQHTNGNIIYA
jgi:predicted ribosome quality control (RQC) complex YloA/Tae2 family protein